MENSDLANISLGKFLRLKFLTTEQNRLRIAIVVSVLFHLLFLILVEYDVIALQTEIPIAPAVEEEKRIVFEIVESNPDYEIESPMEDAQLASDKNTIASDITPETAIVSEIPLTDGIAESNELPVPESQPNEAMQKTSLAPRERFDSSRLLERPENKQEENQELKEQKEQIEQQKQKESKKIQAVLPDNQDANAKDLGGFSLSTYAWDFAPYMLELKRKIGRNIHPPIAFTNFGMISGSYVIQFVITRKGELKSLQVVNAQGDKPLERTSVDAIQFSKPFSPLPKGFPDELLIITGTFNYYNK